MSTMSWTSASLPIATVDTVILSLDIRRSRPWKSPRVIDRRAVVAAEAEALLAADHHEAAAVVPDIVADLRHLRAGQLERRDVGQDDAVELLQSGHVLRDGRRLDHRHVDVLRAERGDQRLGMRAVLVGQEDLRPAADHHRADSAVVLLDGVAFDLDGRLVDVDAALIERLTIGEDVLAGAEPDDLGAEELAVAEEGDPTLGV